MFVTSENNGLHLLASFFDDSKMDPLTTKKDRETEMEIASASEDTAKFATHQDIFLLAWLFLSKCLLLGWAA